jgi:hypothetical protein
MKQNGGTGSKPSSRNGGTGGKVSSGSSVSTQQQPPQLPIGRTVNNGGGNFRSDLRYETIRTL